jgi:hypothetical protein
MIRGHKPKGNVNPPQMDTLLHLGCGNDIRKSQQEWFENRERLAGDRSGENYNQLFSLFLSQSFFVPPKRAG